jgi:tetratricopeptide (TPR) repeat protein
LEYRSESDRRWVRIAESVLHAIAIEELKSIKGKPLQQLRFYQLVMKADQLNYLDRADLSQRTEAAELANKLAPYSGIPASLLAAMVAWKLINGISSNPDADRQLVAEQARRALRLDGDDPYVLQHVGMTYGRMGKFGTSLSLLRRAFDMAPTVTSRDRLARCLSFAGEPEESIGHFKEILAVLPAGIAFPFYVRLAVAQTQAGHLEDALRNAELSTINYPADYYGWFVLANLLELLGRHEEALDSLSTGLQVSSKHLELETVIANTNATYGRTATQRELLTGGLVGLADST